MNPEVEVVDFSPAGNPVVKLIPTGEFIRLNALRRQAARMRRGDVDSGQWDRRAFMVEGKGKYKFRWVSRGYRDEVTVKLEDPDCEEVSRPWRVLDYALVCTQFCGVKSEDGAPVSLLHAGEERCDDSVPLSFYVLHLECPETGCSWDRVADGGTHYRHLRSHGWTGWRCARELRCGVQVTAQRKATQAQLGDPQKYRCPHECSWGGTGRPDLWAHLKTVHGVACTLPLFGGVPGENDLTEKQRLAVFLLWAGC